MRSILPLPMALAALSCAPASPPPSIVLPPSASAPTTASATPCVVWDREVEFAKSVHDHDARAFGEHVQANAVFVGDTVVRGREAIVDSWKGLLRGDDLHLEWHPTSVVFTGDHRLALSRGPYWIELVKPGASPRFLAGVFQSVWMLDADGIWRVTVDGGTAPPQPASEDDVEKIKAAIPAHCPAQE